MVRKIRCVFSKMFCVVLCLNILGVMATEKRQSIFQMYPNTNAKEEEYVPEHVDGEQMSLTDFNYNKPLGKLLDSVILYTADYDEKYLDRRPVTKFLKYTDVPSENKDITYEPYIKNMYGIADPEERYGPYRNRYDEENYYIKSNDRDRKPDFNAIDYPQDGNHLRKPNNKTFIAKIKKVRYENSGRSSKKKLDIIFDDHIVLTTENDELAIKSDEWEVLPFEDVEKVPDVLYYKETQNYPPRSTAVTWETLQYEKAELLRHQPKQRKHTTNAPTADIQHDFPDEYESRRREDSSREQGENNANDYVPTFKKMLSKNYKSAFQNIQKNTLMPLFKKKLEGITGYKKNDVYRFLTNINTNTEYRKLKYTQMEFNTDTEYTTSSNTLSKSTDYFINNFSKASTERRTTKEYTETSTPYSTIANKVSDITTQNNIMTLMSSPSPFPYYHRTTTYNTIGTTPSYFEKTSKTYSFVDKKERTTDPIRGIAPDNEHIYLSYHRDDNAALDNDYEYLKYKRGRPKTFDIPETPKTYEQEKSRGDDDGKYEWGDENVYDEVLAIEEPEVDRIPVHYKVLPLKTTERSKATESLTNKDIRLLRAKNKEQYYRKRKQFYNKVRGTQRPQITSVFGNLEARYNFGSKARKNSSKYVTRKPAFEKVKGIGTESIVRPTNALSYSSKPLSQVEFSDIQKIIKGSETYRKFYLGNPSDGQYYLVRPTNGGPSEKSPYKFDETQRSYYNPGTIKSIDHRHNERPKSFYNAGTVNQKNISDVLNYFFDSASHETKNNDQIIDQSGQPTSYEIRYYVPNATEFSGVTKSDGDFTGETDYNSIPNEDIADLELLDNSVVDPKSYIVDTNLHDYDVEFQPISNDKTGAYANKVKRNNLYTNEVISLVRKNKSETKNHIANTVLLNRYSVPNMERVNVKRQHSTTRIKRNTTEGDIPIKSDNAKETPSNCLKDIIYIEDESSASNVKPISPKPTLTSYAGDITSTITNKNPRRSTNKSEILDIDEMKPLPNAKFKKRSQVKLGNIWRLMENADSLSIHTIDPAKSFTVGFTIKHLLVSRNPPTTVTNTIERKPIIDKVGKKLIAANIPKLNTAKPIYPLIKPYFMFKKLNSSLKNNVVERPPTYNVLTPYMAEDKQFLIELPIDQNKRSSVLKFNEFYLPSLKTRTTKPKPRTETPETISLKPRNLFDPPKHKTKSERLNKKSESRKQKVMKALRTLRPYMTFLDKRKLAQRTLLNKKGNQTVPIYRHSHKNNTSILLTLLQSKRAKSKTAIHPLRISSYGTDKIKKPKAATETTLKPLLYTTSVQHWFHKINKENIPETIDPNKIYSKPKISEPEISILSPKKIDNPKASDRYRYQETAKSRNSSKLYLLFDKNDGLKQVKPMFILDTHTQRSDVSNLNKVTKAVNNDKVLSLREEARAKQWDEYRLNMMKETTPKENETTTKEPNQARDWTDDQWRPTAQTKNTKPRSTKTSADDEIIDVDFASGKLKVKNYERPYNGENMQVESRVMPKAVDHSADDMYVESLKELRDAYYTNKGEEIKSPDVVDTIVVFKGNQEDTTASSMATDEHENKDYEEELDRKLQGVNTVLPHKPYRVIPITSSSTISDEELKSKDYEEALALQVNALKGSYNENFDLFTTSSSTLVDDGSDIFEPNNISEKDDNNIVEIKTDQQYRALLPYIINNTVFQNDVIGNVEDNELLASNIDPGRENYFHFIEPYIPSSIGVTMFYDGEVPRFTNLTTHDETYSVKQDDEQTTIIVDDDEETDTEGYEKVEVDSNFSKILAKREAEVYYYDGDGMVGSAQLETNSITEDYPKHKTKNVNSPKTSTYLDSSTASVFFDKITPNTTPKERTEVIIADVSEDYYDIERKLKSFDAANDKSSTVKYVFTHNSSTTREDDDMETESGYHYYQRQTLKDLSSEYTTTSPSYKQSTAPFILAIDFFESTPNHTESNDEKGLTTEDYFLKPKAPVSSVEQNSNYIERDSEYFDRNITRADTSELFDIIESDAETPKVQYEKPKDSFLEQFLDDTETEVEKYPTHKKSIYDFKKGPSVHLNYDTVFKRSYLPELALDSQNFARLLSSHNQVLLSNKKSFESLSAPPNFGWNFKPKMSNVRNQYNIWMAVTATAKYDESIEKLKEINERKELYETDMTTTIPTPVHGSVIPSFKNNNKYFGKDLKGGKKVKSKAQNKKILAFTESDNFNTTPDYSTEKDTTEKDTFESYTQHAYNFDKWKDFGELKTENEDEATVSSSSSAPDLNGSSTIEYDKFQEIPNKSLFTMKNMLDISKYQKAMKIISKRDLYVKPRSFFNKSLLFLAGENLIRKKDDNISLTKPRRNLNKNSDRINKNRDISVPYIMYLAEFNIDDEEVVESALKHIRVERKARKHVDDEDSNFFSEQKFKDMLFNPTDATTRIKLRRKHWSEVFVARNGRIVEPNYRNKQTTEDNIKKELYKPKKIFEPNYKNKETTGDYVKQEFYKPGKIFESNYKNKQTTEYNTNREFHYKPEHFKIRKFSTVTDETPYKYILIDDISTENGKVVDILSSLLQEINHDKKNVSTSHETQNSPATRKMNLANEGIVANKLLEALRDENEKEGKNGDAKKMTIKSLDAKKSKNKKKLKKNPKTVVRLGNFRPMSMEVFKYRRDFNNSRSEKPIKLEYNAPNVTTNYKIEQPVLRSDNDTKLYFPKDFHWSFIQANDSESSPTKLKILELLNSEVKPENSTLKVKAYGYKNRHVSKKDRLDTKMYPSFFVDYDNSTLPRKKKGWSKVINALAEFKKNFKHT